MRKIVHPLYYQVYQLEGTRWFVLEKGRVFYNPTNTPVQLEHIEGQFGLTESQVVTGLFRISGGKPGYYLANLRDRRYYYCGPNFEDVRTTLQSLGIGRADPLER